MTSALAAVRPDAFARMLWCRWNGRCASGPVVGASGQLLEHAQRMVVPYGRRGLAGYRWQGRGPRVLLVHGWSGRASSLAPLVPTLQQRDHDVVAFDAPGCGATAGIRGSMAAFVDAVSAVERHCGGFDIVIAQGAGTVAALAALGGRSAHRWAFLAPADPPKVVESWCHQLGGARGGELFAAFDRLVAKRLGVRSSHYDLSRLAEGAPGRLLVAHGVHDTSAPFANGQALVDMWPGATMLATSGRDRASLVHDLDVHLALAEYLRTL